MMPQLCKLSSRANKTRLRLKGFPLSFAVRADAASIPRLHDANFGVSNAPSYRPESAWLSVQCSRIKDLSERGLAGTSSRIFDVSSMRTYLSRHFLFSKVTSSIESRFLRATLFGGYPDDLNFDIKSPVILSDYATLGSML